MNGDPAAPYEALAEVIESELAAAGERDFTTLAALKVRRGEIVRALPPRPPAEARAALRRCELMQMRVRVELQRMRDEILFELRCVRQGQRAAGGYAPARPAHAGISASA